MDNLIEDAYSAHVDKKRQERFERDIARLETKLAEMEEIFGHTLKSERKLLEELRSDPQKVASMKFSGVLAYS